MNYRQLYSMPPDAGTRLANAMQQQQLIQAMRLINMYNESPSSLAKKEREMAKAYAAQYGIDTSRGDSIIGGVGNIGKQLGAFGGLHTVVQHAPCCRRQSGADGGAVPGREVPFNKGNDRPVQVTSNTYLDGKKIAETVTTYQTKQASRAPTGPSGVDSSMNLIHAGMGSLVPR